MVIVLRLLRLLEYVFSSFINLDCVCVCVYFRHFSLLFSLCCFYLIYIIIIIAHFSCSQIFRDSSIEIIFVWNLIVFACVCVCVENIFQVNLIQCKQKQCTFLSVEQRMQSVDEKEQCQQQQQQTRRVLVPEKNNNSNAEFKSNAI